MSNLAVVLRHAVAIAIAVHVLVGCAEDFDAGKELSGALSDASGADVVLLSELAPFEWDRAVILRAYASEQDTERLLGFPASNVPAVEDLIHTLLFIRDGRIVVQSEFSGDVIRFDGPGVAFDRGGPPLRVLRDPDTGDRYLVPDGVAPRHVLCGPEGLDGC